MAVEDYNEVLDNKCTALRDAVRCLGPFLNLDHALAAIAAATNKIIRVVVLAPRWLTASGTQTRDAHQRGASMEPDAILDADIFHRVDMFFLPPLIDRALPCHGKVICLRAPGQGTRSLTTDRDNKCQQIDQSHSLL
jgi:hypothetical protein